MACHHPDPDATDTVEVVLRARSILGFHATRTAAIVTVTGAARAYDTATGRYVTWTGQRVRIQRWTPNGWITLAVEPTDDHGNLRALVHVSFTAGLRLTDPSTPTTLGIGHRPADPLTSSDPRAWRPFTADCDTQRLDRPERWPLVSCR